MKKVLFCIVAILTVFALFSCGGEASDKTDEPSGETIGDNVEETSAETNIDEKNEPIRLTDEQKAMYYKVVEFTLPEGDLRDVVVNHMREQANIEWVSTDTFGVSEQFSHWGIALEYKKGETYRGIIYSDYKVSLQQFKDLLINGGYTTDATDWKTVPGVGCYSSILNSVQQFDTKVDGYTDIFMPGHNDFLLKIVGDYKIPDVVRRTQDICEANGADGMYEAYMQLKKGDIIFTKDYYEKGNSVHCRVVVEDAVVFTNANGKFIPTRSKIKTIEQTNKFDEKRTDGVKTTWYIDHEYTFADLYNAYYVPVTFESYEYTLSELEIPYILLDNEITSGVLGKGAFSSSAVKSNYPIRFVEMQILDKSGNVVSEKTVGDMHSTYSIQIRNGFSDIFGKLTKGNEYTLVLTAGISRGSAELSRVDFTLA